MIPFPLHVESIQLSIFGLNGPICRQHHITCVMSVCLCHQVSNHRGSIARGPTLYAHFANLRLAPNHQRQLLTVISYLIPISIKTNYISIFWPLLHILMGFPTIWPALILSVWETFEVKTVSVVISKAPISDQLWLTFVDIGTVNFLPQTIPTQGRLPTKIDLF